MAFISTVTETTTVTKDEDDLPKLVAPQAAPRKYQIIYITSIILVYYHLAAPYAIYLAFTTAKGGTVILNAIVFLLANIGICAGSHRLWSHRSYKAKKPLQILLMLMTCMAYQNTAFDWAKKHRMHHRYCDTDADPHNATRGFFFSHVGWLLVKRHPDVKIREKCFDLSDLYANPVIMFQKRYAIPLILTFCYVLPTIIPVYFFGESLNIAWNITLLRHLCNMHATFSINSFAHLWGTKTYDKTIEPVQNLFVSLVAVGEGFHNYHHSFPWDYRAAELGNDWLNLTSLFITFFAWIGWAYDLKTVPESVVRSRMGRTGDGTNMWGFETNKSVYRLRSNES